MSYDWICPFCHKPTTIVENQKQSNSSHYFDHGNHHGPQVLNTRIIVCPNSKCKKYSLEAELYQGEYKDKLHPIASWHGLSIRKLIRVWQLIPSSNAKPFDDKIIPKQFINDYNEACEIVKLSPKSSATLARRVLQGMIRDYWKIVKGTLNEELNELKGRIVPDAWDAIDAVRKIGNIGAHFEKDVDLIIEIDEGEAEKLIELVEILFTDWYIAHYEKTKRLKELKALAAQKKAQQQKGKTKTKP